MSTRIILRGGKCDAKGLVARKSTKFKVALLSLTILELEVHIEHGWFIRSMLAKEHISGLL